MVIDTMVFAYALLRVEGFHEESLSVLSKASEILVPDSFRSELANVVWQWIKVRGVPLDVGINVLRDADSLITQVISSASLWERALTLSVANNHAAYDTLFIALAERFNTKVVTYDAQLYKIFPENVITLGDFLR